MVDDQALEYLDYFEGVHQNFYSKMKLFVKGVKNDEVHEVNCYVLENFKPYLVENTKYFLNEYNSNNNKSNLNYLKRSDTSDRADTLIEQVKFL